VTNQNPDQEFAVFADDHVAPIVAVDDQIFDLVAPRLVSFSDAQLRRVLDLARGMSRARSERYLTEIARRLSVEPSDHETALAIVAAANLS
jgi:hypothetical protein